MDWNHLAAVTSEAESMAPSEPGPPAGRIAITSDAMPSVVRYVDSYATLAREISLSRIYAGAHFRSSTAAGADLGKRVAEYELLGFLKPLP